MTPKSNVLNLILPRSHWARACLPLIFIAAFNPFGFGYFAAAPLALLILLGPTSGRRAPIRPSLVALLAFDVAHILLYTGDSYERFAVPIVATLVYLTGLMAGSASSVHLLLTATLGTFCHAALNLLLTGFDGLTNRVQIDAWTRAETSATVHAALWIPVIGSLPLIWFAGKGWNLVFKAVAMGAGALVTTFGLLSATRSTLLILGITIAASFILFASSAHVVRAIIALPFAATLGWIVFGWFSASVVDLPLVNRLSEGDASTLTNDPRFQRQAIFLENFWSYAGGGGEFRAKYGYAHNIVLDEIDTASIVAGLFLAFFLFATVSAALSGALAKNRRSPFLLLSFGIGLASTLHFMVEPVLEASPQLFYVFALLGGTVALDRAEGQRQVDEPALAASRDPNLPVRIPSATDLPV